MTKQSKLLFVYPADNEQAKIFATGLGDSLVDWNIHCTNAALTTLLFDIRRYDFAHFFMPAAARSAQVIRRMKGKTKLLQTILSGAEEKMEFAKVVFGDALICLSEQTKNAFQKQIPEMLVETIPPGVQLPAAG